MGIKAGNREDNIIEPDNGMKLGYEVVISHLILVIAHLDGEALGILNMNDEN